jgi:PKHD-type hydroxylase
MVLNEYFWFFEKALSHKFCDEIITYGKSKYEKNPATIGSVSYEGRDFDKNPLSTKEINFIKKSRNSKVAWLNEPWIYKEIYPFINTANKNAGWNFKWDNSEYVQFTTYEIGQYYDWHQDAFALPFNRPNSPENNKIRKLSVTCSLSDSSEYKGGELEFNFNDPLKSKKENFRKCTEILPKGSIVVFPSFVYHRVCPVIQGTRHSLVIWNIGNPYE